MPMPDLPCTPGHTFKQQPKALVTILNMFTLAAFCSDSAGGTLQQHFCGGTSGGTLQQLQLQLQSMSSADPLD